MTPAATSCCMPNLNHSPAVQTQTHSRDVICRQFCMSSLGSWSFSFSVSKTPFSSVSIFFLSLFCVFFFYVCLALFHSFLLFPLLSCFLYFFPFLSVCLSFLLPFSFILNRLAGLVVKASPSGAEDPGFESRLRQDFFESSHTSDLKIGTPAAALPGAWHYRVKTWTSRPGVSLL